MCLARPLPSRRVLHATLTAVGLKLVLRVDGYELPQIDTGWDANWLVCRIQLDLAHHYGTIHAEHRLSILTVDLADFTRQLHALNRELTGRATLKPIEEQIRLTITLDHGKGTIDGSLAAPAAAAAKVSFECIPIDQSYLPPLLSDLDARTPIASARRST